MNRAHLTTAVVAAMVAIGYLGGFAGGAAAQADDRVDDRRCGAAASDVREFGGAYVAARETDGLRVLHVWMTGGAVELSDTTLASLREHCPDYDEIVIQDAKYSYQQLAEWRQVAGTIDTVTLAGVDSRSNRLTLGVADLAADGKALRETLVRNGVPLDAVVLIEISQARTLPIVDHSRLVGLFAALGTAVLVVTVVGGFLRRRRRVARGR